MDGPSWLHYSVTLCVQSWAAGVSSESDSAPGVRSGQRGGNSKLLLYSGFGIKGLGSIGLRVYRDDYV